jgi:large subunit ribosomal protein L21e
MTKSKGYRAKTRSLLKRSSRERGKIGLSKILHEYKSGDKVVININPAVQKGMPHRRYHGRVGIISSKRGRGYVVTVTQGKKDKEITTRSEHLKVYEEE